MLVQIIYCYKLFAHQFVYLYGTEHYGFRTEIQAHFVSHKVDIVVTAAITSTWYKSEKDLCI